MYRVLLIIKVNGRINNKAPPHKPTGFPFERKEREEKTLQRLFNGLSYRVLNHHFTSGGES